MKGKDSIITVEFTDGEKWIYTVERRQVIVVTDKMLESQWTLKVTGDAMRRTSDIKRISWKDTE